MLLQLAPHTLFLFVVVFRRFFQLFEFCESGLSLYRRIRTSNDFDVHERCRSFGIVGLLAGTGGKTSAGSFASSFTFVGFAFGAAILPFRLVLLLVL
jgi:hypothetical protein